MESNNSMFLYCSSGFRNVHLLNTFSVGKRKSKMEKKKPTRDDQAYNDETVYHIRKSTNKITTAIATMENVQDNMEFSLANYQSQPLLTNIVRYQENEPMIMLTNI